MSSVTRDWRILAASAVVGCLVTALLIWVATGRDADGSEDTKTATDPMTTQDSPTPSATPGDSPSPKVERRKRTRPQPPAPPTETTYSFPIDGCNVSYSTDHHNYPATDIFAAEGCAFVAPVDGVVDEVGTVDAWTRAENRGEDRGGLFVSVVGVDGVRYYGSHLSAVAPGIEPGTKVVAGTRLGSIGETGSAAGTGAHLHFGISWPSDPGMWWVRRGVVSPAPYLDSWRAGRQQSPVQAVGAARTAQEDQLRTCQQYC